MEQVLDQLAHESAQRGAEMQLSWIATATLFGGTALYFGARAIFMKVAAGYSIRGALIAVGLAVLLIPAARALPAIAALGLLTVFVLALVVQEWGSPPGYDPPQVVGEAPERTATGDVFRGRGQQFLLPRHAALNR
ncbi:low temperature requirement protein A [Micromonospora sp. MED01]|nr:low temperature requirement protein A [Micromonospora alfalfae]